MTALIREVGGGYHGPAMAYDEALAQRIRQLLADEPSVEKKMFGGLAFLIGGNMAVAASGQGGLLVHVDPTESAVLVESSPAEPMVMRGREMPGWLRISSDDLVSDDTLSVWVGRGVGYAGSLPAK